MRVLSMKVVQQSKQEKLPCEELALGPRNGPLPLLGGMELQATVTGRPHFMSSTKRTSND